MERYEDERLATEEEMEKMKGEYLCEEGVRKRLLSGKKLPVYLTDKAAQTAKMCEIAVSNAEFLLDYASDEAERERILYVKEAMSIVAQRFYAEGIKESARKAQIGDSPKRMLFDTAVMCEKIARQLSFSAFGSCGSLNEGTVLLALCSSQALMSVYLM